MSEILDRPIETLAHRAVIPTRPARGRIGLFSIGLAAYWPQFPGLKERLEGYGQRVAERVALWADVVSGLLDGADDTRAWREIGAWCRAAGAARALRRARVGMLGHTYPGMLDLYSDFTQHQAQLGLHVEVLEMDDLQARVEAVSDADVARVLAETRALFTLDDSVRDDQLHWAARAAAGMDLLAADYRLDALAYYYRGCGACHSPSHLST